MSSTLKKIKLCMLITAALIGQAHAIDGCETLSTVINPMHEPRPKTNLSIIVTAIGQAHAIDEGASDLNPKLTVSVPGEVCGKSEKSLETPVGGKSPRSQAIAKSSFDLAMRSFENGEIENGLKQLKQSVAMRYAPAQVKFGLLCQTGEYGECGIEKDESLAAQLFQRAVAQGDTDALFRLAWLYEHGSTDREQDGGVRKNRGRAFGLYLRAEARGNPDASARLGDIFRLGLCGMPRDFNMAASHYKVAYYCKSAQNKEVQEESDKKPLLSHTPEAGENDFELAMKSFENDEIENGLKQLKQSADMEYGLALVELGFLCQTGKYGIKKDEDLAVELFQMALKKGSSMAFIMLGNIFEHGLCGEKKDRPRALFFYRAAYSSESTKKKRTQITDNHLPREHSEAGAIGPEQLAYILGNLYWK